MTEVRRHQRTVDGKTVNVRRHTRSGTGTAAERRQDAWEDRAAERWTPPPRPGASDAGPAEESWWDDDTPRPEAWHDTGEGEDEMTDREKKKAAIARWKAAKEALRDNAEMEQDAGIDWETEEYHRLNHEWNEAEKDIPWYRKL